MAMIATAIISSISVNPRARLRRVPKGDIDEDFIMLSVQWRQIHLPLQLNPTPCCLGSFATQIEPDPFVLPCFALVHLPLKLNLTPLFAN